jgi:hypothetical protein
MSLTSRRAKNIFVLFLLACLPTLVLGQNDEKTHRVAGVGQRACYQQR